MLIAGLFVLASCSKVKNYRNLPPLQGQSAVDSLAALRAWVEQIAIEKRDSMRIADSLAALTHTVDTNTLFGKKYLMIALVEANDHYFPNVNCYRDQNGKPVFDLAFPFSANLNINPSTGKAYVQYNPEHQAMLADAREFIRSDPWILAFPGLAILITVVAINLTGDGLRDALDPKMRRG